MESVDAYPARRCGAISALCTFFITYPNVVWIPWNVTNSAAGGPTRFWVTFAFRCIFFFVLFYFQLRSNATWPGSDTFWRRFGKNFLFTLTAGGIFVTVSYLVPLLGIQSGTVGKHLTFQFLVECLLCTFIGYISELNAARGRKELELERLRTENLESRCNALAGHINPHFFFNSLNGISSLVQRGDEDVTLDYIDRLSDIFRYTLQSQDHQLVSLKDELRFVDSFAYVMEVRFGGKLNFRVDVPDRYMPMRLPVLSFLPVLENITVHNRIDSSHPMEVSIGITGNNVVVKNNINPRRMPADTHGTGLVNLDNRFRLMTGHSILTENDGMNFNVSLPLSTPSVSS